MTRRREAVTRDDVARAAGVSPRTVSNVVNGYAHVAPQTREHVQAVIDRLGYKVSTTARSLRTGQTGLLGLVVPALDQPYFAELARAIIRAANTAGYTMVIDQTDGDPARERQFLRDGARGAMFDGLIISPLALTAEDLQTADPHACPVVLLGERTVDASFDHVGIDNVAAAYEATAHLIAIGRRRVAAIGTQQAGEGQTGLQRTTGYLKALDGAGIPAPLEYLRHADSFDRATGFEQMTALLHLDTPPDAVFCFNDTLALGALRACLSRGVRVPDDVALVGFDDIEESRYSTPTLTTIRPDRQAIAHHAVTRLVTRIETHANEQPRAEASTVPHRLIERESSTPARSPVGSTRSSRAR